MGIYATFHEFTLYWMVCGLDVGRMTMISRKEWCFSFPLCRPNIPLVKINRLINNDCPLCVLLCVSQSKSNENGIRSWITSYVHEVNNCWQFPIYFVTSKIKEDVSFIPSTKSAVNSIAPRLPLDPTKSTEINQVGFSNEHPVICADRLV